MNCVVGIEIMKKPSIEIALPEDTTDVEFVVQEIWRDVLGRTSIQLDDNFASLGGQSLLGVRINSQLRAILGIELPLSVQFKTPTVRGLSATLTSIGRTSGIDIGAIAATFREVSKMSEADLAELGAAPLDTSARASTEV